MVDGQELEKPDLGYLRKALKRQFLPSFILGIIIANLALVAALNTKNVYRSTVSIVLDNRDLVVEPFSGKSWALATQRNFRIKFSSQEFLDRIVREAKIELPTDGFINSLRQKSTQEPIDPRKTKYLLNRKLMGAIVASDERGDGALTLSVDWDNPEEAQRIASQAMDIWPAAA